MKIIIEKDFINDVKILSNLLVFSGGRGLPLSTLEKEFDEDLENLLSECQKIFNFIGIEVITSEDRLFILPQRSVYQEIQQANLSNLIPRLTRKQRLILLRFLSLYYSQIETNPISKQKFKFEMEENFDMDIRRKDLNHLNKLGYIRIIRDQFIDIGWKLKGSEMLAIFRQNLRSVFSEIFNLERELTTDSEDMEVDVNEKNS